jgi:hypothetical protein
VQAAFEKEHWCILPAEIPIVPAQCGNWAGVIGAAASARGRAAKTN